MVSSTVQLVIALGVLSVVVPGVNLALLCIPFVKSMFQDFAYANLSGLPLVGASIVMTVRHFTYCMGDYLGCVKGEALDEFVRMYGWEGGIAQFAHPFPSYILSGYHELPVAFSHPEYRAVAHDPKAGRPPHMFIGQAKKHLPDGLMPDGENNILLNFDTGNPEWFKRRTLLADMLPALANTGKVLTAKVPAIADLNTILIPRGWTDKFKDAKGSPFKRAVWDTVGYNLFLEMFGTDISENLAEHFQYDEIFAPGVIGIPVTSGQGARLREIRGKITKKVYQGDIAKNLIAEAAKRGMNGTQRLNEMIWITMFAGYGGTGNLAFETLKMVQADPAKYVPMFRKNPRSFMIESSRMNPPVAGMNPFAFRKSQTFNLKNGRTLKVGNGDIGYILNSGANFDPRVFPNPKKFDMERPNVEKMLSWNNEIDEFAKCKSPAGCPEAPRGCLGTWPSLRIATSVVDVFIGVLEKAGKVGKAGKGRNEL